MKIPIFQKLVHLDPLLEYNRRSSEYPPVARIMACSLSKEHEQLLYVEPPRKLCEDRQAVFSHLRPRKFTKNFIRIAVMQSTTVVTNYYNDQLKEDIEREERIQSGELTRKEAEKEEEEWQEREWSKRIDGLSHRIVVAFAKYHAIVLVMRFYEHVASKFVTEETLDKLTLDTFECSRRESRAGKDGRVLVRSMIPVCWKANMISYLADFSVHQVLLAVAYITYIQQQRRKVKERNDAEAKERLQAGPLMLSFFKRSTLLAISRGIGLGFSSVGGAVGSAIWPGWGTLAGVNFGDSVSMQLTEETDILEPQSW